MDFGVPSNFSAFSDAIELSFCGIVFFLENFYSFLLFSFSRKPAKFEDLMSLRKINDFFGFYTVLPREPNNFIAIMPKTPNLKFLRIIRKKFHLCKIDSQFFLFSAKNL